MRIRSVLSLAIAAVALVGGCAQVDPAGPQEPAMRRFSFAADQASVAVTPDVIMRGQHRSSSDLVFARRAGHPILGIYAGNKPYIDALKKNLDAVVQERIGGLVASTFRLHEPAGLSRQTILFLGDSEWPEFVHFFYSDLSPADAAAADRIIDSMTFDARHDRDLGDHAGRKEVL